jgi:hypothetical protein
MAATPVVDYDRLIHDLRLPEAIFEYLFGNRDDIGYRIKHFELTPTEYAGLFVEGQDWYINLHPDLYDCLEPKGLDRVRTYENILHVNALVHTIHNNNNAVPKATTNENYDANTEGTQREAQKPLVPYRDTKKLVTPRGNLKLPKFKRHSLYRKYPWLQSFRPHGQLNMYFFEYRNEYLAEVIPPTMAYAPGYGENNMWNWQNQQEEEVWEDEITYAVLVPYGFGHASLFILKPDPIRSEDKTQNVIDSIRGCAVRTVPRAPFLNNVPRGARTVRRLGILKSLPKKLSTNVFRAHVMPALGNEHLGPRLRKARKTRKHRTR